MFRLFFLLVCLKLIIAPLVGGEEIEGGRSLLSYSPDLLLAVLFCVTLAHLIAVQRASKFLLKTSLLMLAALVIFLISGYINGVPLFTEVQSFTRTILPVALIALMRCLSADHQQNFRRIYSITRSLGLLVLLLTWVGIYFLPESTNRNEVWLPAYFGGLHNSSYTLLAGLACVYASWYYRASRANLLLLTFYGIFTLYMLAFGWGVRSSMVALLVMAIGPALYRRRFDPLAAIVIAGGAVAVLVWTAVEMNLLPFGVFDFFTSGRISMYSERVELLQGFRSWEWLFGRGAGADLIVSNIWWWAEKGSHNDFMTFLFEHGVAFLSVMLIIMFTFYRAFRGGIQRSLLAAVFVTSTISNGYMVRPIPFYCIALPLILFSRCERQRRTTLGARRLEKAGASRYQGRGVAV